MQPQHLFPLQPLSHDSNLIDLFNELSSMEQQKKPVQSKEQSGKYMHFDLNLSYDDIEKGYCSDIQIDQRQSQKGVFRKKPKQIINRKQKKLSKRRTRVYIQMLQNRNEELEIQLKKQRKLNKTNREYIKKLNQSEHTINGYFIGRQQVYEKLQHLLSSSNPNKQQILQEIGILRLRQGVLGKDRAKATNYYFKEMMDMFLPEIQKYLIKSATQQSDMFDPNYLQTGQFNEDIEFWRKKMLEDLNLKKQTRNCLPGIRERILKEKTEFDQLLQQFYELKCEITKKARKMQVIFDEIGPFLTPLEVGRCLCYADRYRFEKKLSIEENVKHIFQKLKGQQMYYKNQNLFSEGMQKIV